jgi:biotin carboxylase
MAVSANTSSQDKVLILGANYETIRLVSTCKRLGYYVYVADYNLNSPAKSCANEPVHIDASQVDDIVRFCNDNFIRSVILGVADRLVKPYKDICLKLKIPCYADIEALGSLTDKLEFSYFCQSYGLLHIPYTIFSDATELPKLQLPAFVKPTDSSAGTGVQYCESTSELRDAVHNASSVSRNKQVLIERAMIGQDIGIYFDFNNTKGSCVATYDRFTVKQSNQASRIAGLMVYPSKYTSEYMKNVNPKLISALHSLKIHTGVCLISAFYEDGNFYLYDPGFRFQGEASDHYLYHLYNYDQRENMIVFSLGRHAREHAPSLSYKFNGRHAATVWILLQAGTISFIHGIQEVKDLEGVIKIDQRFSVGDVIDPVEVGTEKQVFARIYTVGTDRQTIIGLAKQIYDLVEVFDDRKMSLKVPFPQNIS